MDDVQEVKIISTRHCDRTLSGIRTPYFLSACSAIQAGSQLQEISFLLRHPEEMLLDLSNPEQPFSFCPPAEIERVFLQVKQEIESMTMGEIKRIYGNDLRPEIAISGPSRENLRRWKEKFFKKLSSRLTIKRIETEYSSRGINRVLPITSVDFNVQSFIRHFSYFYSQFVHSAYWSEHPCLGLKKIYPCHLIWDQINRIPGAKIFILSAGLSLGISYMAATQDSRIFFTEFHRQNDPNQLSQRGIFKGIYPKPSGERDWVVIDKAYSGGTIDEAEELLRSTFGREINVTKVALFPKSLDAVKRADFIVYAGRLIPVVKVRDSLSSENWHIELLYKSDV